MAKKKRVPKKKLTANQKAYKQVASAIRKSVSRARAEGFDIEYEMRKPDIITKKYLEALRGINLAKVKQGVDIPGLKIRSYNTGTGIDLRPKRRKQEEEGEKREEPKKVRKKKEKPPKEPEPVREPEPLPEAPPEPEPKREPEQLPKMPEYTAENPEYWYDTATGEKFLPGDDRIYERDKDGRIITDSNGRPKIRDDIVPVTSAPLPKDEYQDLVWQNIKYNFGGRYEKSVKANDFQKWLDKMKEQYGVFGVRDMLYSAITSGANLDRDFFYHASWGEYNVTINTLEAMLRLGNFSYEDTLQLSEITERAEGGFIMPE